MSNETFEGYDRISAVSHYFKTEDYIGYVESTDKRSRNMAIKRAKLIGQRVDDIIKFGAEPDKKDKPEVHSAYKGWCSFVKNYNPSIQIGNRFFNEELKITGELDLILNGDEISDIKCALHIFPEYWIQLGGYLLVYPAKKVSIIRLSKTTDDYEYVVRENVDELKMLFVSALNLYRYWRSYERN